MSYLGIGPGYYEMLSPGTPWQSGSSGWTRAPWPEWGENPNKVGPQFLAVHGPGLGVLGGPVGQPPPVRAYREGSLGQEEPNDRSRAGARALIGLFGLAALLAVGLVALGAKPKQRANPCRRRNYRRNARWSTEYKNRLPDSAFLYIEKGGRKVREDGKTYTEPKSLRKFPYKNHLGTVDLPHLRNAIARAPVADIPASDARRVQTKARRLLARQDAKAA